MATIDPRHTEMRFAGLAGAALRRQAGQRQQAAESAQRSTDRLDALRRMASGIALDFNNIFGAIVGYANLLSEAVTEAEAGQGLPAGMAAQWRGDLAKLIEMAGRATGTTKILERFGSRPGIPPGPLDVTPVVGHACDLLRRHLKESIRLDVQLDPELPAARAGADQVTEILRHLTSNAIDAMPAGGTLRVATASTDAAGQGDPHGIRPPGPHQLTGRCIRLTVADTGGGMTTDVLGHAIEPFYTSQPMTHAGLGLTAVYGAVVQAGGDLIIETAPGRGTTVHVCLPAAAQPAGPPSPGEAPGQARLPTVLVADDEPALRDIAARILRRAGYTVLTAESGPDALQVAARHPGSIEYLLTDVVMPNMLGSELARLLAAARPGIQVRYMSGYADPMFADDKPGDPAPVIIGKPFTPRHLLDALAGHDASAAIGTSA